MPEKSLLTDLLPWAPLIGTLGGVLFTGVISLGITWINKKAEGKRHFQDLIFKSVVEEWKQHSTFAIELMKLNTGKKIAIEPLTTYLFHILKLSEILIDGKTTKENIPEKLTEVREFMKEIKKFTALPKEKE